MLLREILLGQRQDDFPLYYLLGRLESEIMSHNSLLMV